MAKKPMKIKRYHGYLGQRRKPVVTFFLMLLWAVIVATLVVVGIAIYEPVMDYITQRGENSSQESSSLPSESSSSSSEESSSQPEEEPEEVPSAVRAVYLAHSVLTDSQKLEEFLDNALKNGANTVIVDVKNENGAVLHLSQVKTASEALAISDAAVDLGETAKAISEKGLRPVARIYAFEDHVASYSLRRMGCFYQTANTLWYDNLPANGGQPWLNPYSQEAQDYIQGLAVESAGLGFEEIMLAGVQFPWGYQLENVYFGEAAAETTKAALLEGFSKQLQERLSAMDVDMSVMMRASDILASNGFTYGEGNPLERFPCPVYIDFSPDHFLNSATEQYAIGELTLSGTTEETVVINAAFTAIKAQMDEEKLEQGKYRAVIQCEKSSGQLTAENIQRQAELLTGKGLKDVFFGSEFSSYPAKIRYDAGLEE